MPIDLESSISDSEPLGDSKPSNWFSVVAIAAASALAGGLAAAWFYRKTLTQLRQAEVEPLSSNFGISEDDPEEDL